MADKDSAHDGAPAEQPDFGFTSEAGISPQDRQEIAAKIEAVARESRIQVTPELLAVQARRTGALLPLLVNAVGVLVLAAGLAGGFLLFRRSEAARAESRGTFSTAEGRIIEELRRHSEAQLEAKDQEMRAIQARLAGVEREREQILAEIDERVREREEQLRATLLAELADEQRRLEAEGQSGVMIESRLSDLRVRRDGEIRREVDAYRQQLEQEWDRRLAGLRAAESEYQQSLRDLEHERLAISRELQDREAALRRQAADQALAVREAAVLSEQARAEAEAAQDELLRLTEGFEQRSLVESQISGFYSRIAEAAAARRYEQALESIDGLRALLQDPRFLSLPGVQERLRIDLFLTDSLRALVRGELERTRAGLSRADEERLRSEIEAEELGLRLEGFEREAEAAQAAQAAGDLRGALLGYARALSMLPAPGFAEPQRERALEAVAGAAEALARESAEGARSEARGAYEAQLAEAGSAAAAAYERRLAEARSSAAAQYQRQLAQESARTEERLRQQLLRELQAAVPAVREPPPVVEPVSSPEAAALVARADASLAAGRYQEAVRGYVEVVNEHPRSTQVAQALRGIEDAHARTLQGAAAAREQLAGELDGLRAAHTRLQGEAERLRVFESREQGLRAGYGAYQSREDELLRARGEMGLAEAKLALDEFLALPPMREVFPGLAERLQRYHTVFEREGGENAILAAIAIAGTLAGQRGPQAMHAFLDGELARNRDNEFVQEFVEELRYLVPSF